jgi:sortase A
VPQVPPPPFGVAVSPGGESLFQPPKRRARLREPEPGPAVGSGDSPDIPRRPAAGGLIAGWNRPAPEDEEPPPAGGAFTAFTRQAGGQPPAPSTQRTDELWNSRPAPAAEPPAPERPRRIRDGADRSGPPAPPAEGRSRAGQEQAARAADAGGDRGTGPAPGRRPDPWDRPAAQGRPTDWDRAAGAEAADRPAGGGWDTVLPPVGGAPRGPDPGTAGVDEATTFMSQWGPPPLRPTEDRGGTAPGWGRPAAPSRAGAGRSADNPVERPPSALPPVADAPPGSTPPTGPGGMTAAASGAERAPTEPAAERWIADRLAAEQSASSRSGAEDPSAGYWSAGRLEVDGPGTPDADEPADYPSANRAGARQPVEDGFAGYWVRDRPNRPPPPPTAGTAGPQEQGEAGGPLGVGAWSRDGTAAPPRPRGRQRPGERPEPVAGHPDDRGPAGGGGEPPQRPGGGGRGGAPAPRRRTLGDRIRTFLRGIGQTFLTLGLVLLLFAAYEVWFTDLVNHRTQDHLTTALQDQWAQGGDDPTVGTPAEPGKKVRSIPLGDAFALIYIPDFGTDYVFSVVEGTGVNELNEGPGHYVDTPLPGAVGNVAIAGHRVGKGSPFLNLDKLAAGSAIVIRTKSYWYTYRVVGDKGGSADGVSPLGFPGREIVDPSDAGVIAPVPDKPGAKATRRLLTLTTCHPKFTARQRMVIHAQLDGAPFPASQGTPPSLTGG